MRAIGCLCRYSLAYKHIYLFVGVRYWCISLQMIQCKSMNLCPQILEEIPSLCLPKSSLPLKISWALNVCTPPFFIYSISHFFYSVDNWQNSQCIQPQVVDVCIIGVNDRTAHTNATAVMTLIGTRKIITKITMALRILRQSISNKRRKCFPQGYTLIFNP